MSSQLEMLERIAIALETIAGTTKEEMTAEQRRMRALSEMVACKGNMSKVAKKIGCHRKTLLRDETLVHAFQVFRNGLSMQPGDPRRASSLAALATHDHHDLE